MLTITLPRGIDASLNQIVQEEMERCLEVLAERYNFSAEEAVQHLPEFKLVKKRGPIPKLRKAKAQAVVAAPSKGPPQMSGYLLFSKTMRSDVQVVLSASLEGEQKLLPQLVVKELAVRWNALSVYEKKEWKSRAASKVPEAPPPKLPLIAQDPGVNQIDGELSRQELMEMRTDANAEQLPIEYERMTHWTVEQTVDYFESAGAIEPMTEEISRLPLLQAQRGVAQHAPGWYKNEPSQERPAAAAAPPVKVEEESEEETTVVQFEIGGIKYLKDDENTLYDFETHEEVGVWNENECCMETIM
jgi:hypothetical protein